MSGPFKMKGHTLPGPNQTSPAKDIKTFSAEDDASVWNDVTSHNEAHALEKGKPKKKKSKTTPDKKGKKGGGGARNYSGNLQWNP